MLALSFQNNRFVLFENGAFVREIKDFFAAREYKNFADARAARILDRAFVKFFSFNADKIPNFLDDHQKAGVGWALTRSRSYLAHAPGAGKTLQAITAAWLTPGPGQTVFIVPPSLTTNWVREIMKFWELAVPNRKSWPTISVIPGVEHKEWTGWKADFIVVPDSMLTKRWVLNQLLDLNIKFLGVDEASRFKEATAQRTIALFGGKFSDGRRTAGLVQNSKIAVLLDGSPMPNRSMELWAPTYGMAPETIGFMSQHDFGQRYCGARINDYGKYEFKWDSNSDELKMKLQKSFMHVVPESALNHPERRRSILFMNEDVRSVAHKSWEKVHLGAVNFDDISEDMMSQGKMAFFRRELGLRKVDWVENYVKERMSTKKESILLFAWHKEVCERLAGRLRGDGFALVYGDTPMSEREKIFALFQKGRIRGIVGNILAMGRGNNLQRGELAIFAEFSFSNETNIQAEKRISRRGNENAFMRSLYIVCPNSLDEPALSSVFRKEKAVRKVIG